MAWTYSGDPANSPRDEIRFLVGDTKETPQSLTDDEIAYLLSKNDGAIRRAAADAAEAMGAGYVELSVTSKKMGDLSLSYAYETTYKRYYDLASKIRSGSGLSGMPIMRDWSANQFTVGLMDNDPHGRGRDSRLL